MVVVCATDLPPAVRGRMKLWFVEAQPGIFVSGLNDALADEVVNYLFDKCNTAAGITIFTSRRNPPGYTIRTIGYVHHPLASISGLQLLKTKEGDLTEDKMLAPF